MDDFEENVEMGLGTLCFQGLPIEVVWNGGYTTSVAVPVGDICGCTSLHHFYFADILLGVGGLQTVEQYSMIGLTIEK